MTVLSPRPEIALRAVAGKGRGVFAPAAIAGCTIIERAPALLLTLEDCDRLEATGLGDYYFAHPDNDEEGLFPLGLATLLNHAEQPNAETTWQRDPEVGWLVSVVALRDIAAGEEITRRYRCPPWFAVVD